MKPEDWLSDEEVVIYLFHGVVKQSSHPVRNYNRKHLPADEFRGILADLRRLGNPVSMDEVLLHSAGTPCPPRSFAVTFDDGFENNLSVAAPILRELDVPAMLYVTTGFVERDAMSWIDRIELCLEQVSNGALKLPWADAPRSFSDPRGTIELLEEIRREVKRDAELDVDAFVTSVFEQCSLDEVHSSPDPLDRKLSWAEVAEWAATPGLLLGGHSHTHRILSFLSADELETEIDTSLRLLREKANLSVHHYSYPEGLSHCYSDQVIDVLKERGIDCCPTAEPGTNPPGSDPFRLRRVAVA